VGHVKLSPLNWWYARAGSRPKRQYWSHIPHYVNLANSLRAVAASAEFAPSEWQVEYSLSAATQILYEPAAAWWGNQKSPSSLGYFGISFSQKSRARYHRGQRDAGLPAQSWPCRRLARDSCHRLRIAGAVFPVFVCPIAHLWCEGRSAYRHPDAGYNRNPTFCRGARFDKPVPNPRLGYRAMPIERFL
jgi:hypothetical protein